MFSIGEDYPDSLFGANYVLAETVMELDLAFFFLRPI